MQYKGLEITAFEQEPGKWRARIVAANGRPLKGDDRQLLESVTGATAVDALTLAMGAVDAAGFFFRLTGEWNDFGESFFGPLRLVAAGRIRSPRKKPDGDVCWSRRAREQKRVRQIGL